MQTRYRSTEARRIWKVVLTATLLTASWVALARAQNGNGALEVTVGNVRKAAGHVRVAVCTQGSFLKDNRPFQGSAPARLGSVVVTVHNLPPGTYAVQAFQDEIDTGRIKRSLPGVPEEGFGFSRDAPTSFAPPSSNSAAFQLPPGGGKIALRLRYMG